MTDLFGTGVSGLLAMRRALATTGHNISNVNTDGYTRQRVELDARQPQGYGNGFVGQGVGVTTVERMLDSFVGNQIRTSTAAHGQVDVFHRLSGQVDNLLADADAGLAPALQSFFGSLQDLSADPASMAARQVAFSEAEALAQRFRVLDDRLEDLSTGVERQLADAVEELNGLAEGVADMNKRIVLAENAAGGQPANDLRDQRDQLVGRIAELVDVSVIKEDDGSLNVSGRSGQMLVVGQSAVSLSYVPGLFDGARGEIGASMGGAVGIASARLGGGKLQGLLDFREQVLEPARSGLGRVALGLSASMNDQHRLGADLQGQPGGDLFQALDLSAPAVFEHRNNTGAPTLDVQVRDVGALTASDYELRRSGASYTLTRLDDGQSTTLSGFPAGAAFVDGLRLEVSAGAMADGDRLLIQPTRDAAGQMALALPSAERIAAAAPVRAEGALANTGAARVDSLVVNAPGNDLRFTFTGAATFDVVDSTTGARLATGLGYTSGNAIAFNGISVSISGAPAVGDSFSVDNGVSAAGAANTGTGSIGEATVNDADPDLRDPVTITFDDPPTTFTVAGATTGTPTAGVSYTSGQPFSFNGWTMTLQGTPAAGDRFTVGPNAGAVGDNRNALALAALQTGGTLDGGNANFEDAYGQVLVEVGSLTRQADVNRLAQRALLDQATLQRESVSGVNLDEEAANMLRFQQAYQASAQIIATADEIFQTLLQATAR